MATEIASAPPDQAAAHQVHPHQRERLALSYVVLIITTIFLLLPIVWLVLASFKSDVELSAFPIKVLPEVWRVQNYIDAVTMIDFPRYAGNSVVLATTNASLTVITSALVGFAFARIEAPGRGRLFGLVVALLMVPAVVYVIPQYVVFARIGLVRTWWPWVLWGISASPFHIFLFRQFFSAFPKELEDAAEVDGCSLFRIWWQIFLPNAKPAMAVSFILAFVWVWGDWFSPLLYLTDANTTLAVKLANAYVDPFGNPLITVTLAASILYALPLIVMFFIGQRYILEGVVTTGLKG